MTPLDALPPSHWAKKRATGNYVIAGSLLCFAGGVYAYTMNAVQSKDDIDVAIARREGGKGDEGGKGGGGGRGGGSMWSNANKKAKGGK
jgi:hypothetical protein